MPNLPTARQKTRGVRRAREGRGVLEGLHRLVGDPTAVASTILRCDGPARFHLRCFLEPFLPRVAVLSPAEIRPGISVRFLGVAR